MVHADSFLGHGHYPSEYCVGQEHSVSRGTLYRSQESQLEDKDKGRSGGGALDSTRAAWHKSFHCLEVHHI